MPNLSPIYEAEDLLTLKCAVVPKTIMRIRTSRSAREFEYGIGVDLQCSVTLPDPPRLRALNTAAEQIHDWLDNTHTLTGLMGWICLTANRQNVCDDKLLYSDKIWKTLVEVSVRGYRE